MAELLVSTFAWPDALAEEGMSREPRVADGDGAVGFDVGINVDLPRAVTAADVVVDGPVVWETFLDKPLGNAPLRASPWTTCLDVVSVSIVRRRHGGDGPGTGSPSLRLVPPCSMPRGRARREPHATARLNILDLAGSLTLPAGSAAAILAPP